MKEFPSENIVDKIDYIEFHNTKGKLGIGTYEVVEADGEINYAVISFDGSIEWYSVDEYLAAKKDNRDFDAELDADWEKDFVHNQDGIALDELEYDYLGNEVSGGFNYD